MAVKRKNTASAVAPPAKKGRISNAQPQQPDAESSDSEFDDKLPADEKEKQLIAGAKKGMSMLQKFTLEHFSAGMSGGMSANDMATKLFLRKNDKSSDFANLPLKQGHNSRPLYLHPRKGIIYLQAKHPLAMQAQDFLITIAEPRSRPTFIHEYVLTIHSLYAAVSVGLHADEIINTLDRFLKHDMPVSVVQYIRNFTASFGKLRMVLKNTRYFLESSDTAVLKRVLSHPYAAECRNSRIVSSKVVKRGVMIPGTKNAAGVEPPAAELAPEVPKSTLVDEDEDDDDEQVFGFEVPDSSVETILDLCTSLQFPVLEEYEFRNDEANPTLDISLRPNFKLRPYQEKSLSKMFGNGSAKSGIIVLPCGAGKTLVGITAACTIKKGCIVLCTSSMSAVQWRAEAIKFSNIDPDDVAVFTSDNKKTFKGNTGIIVTTYSMVTMSRERSHESKKMMDFITQREWGLMLLDEVHVVPAAIFRKVISKIKTHCKLGLTATMLREDNKINDLNFLIGPKLYEANWMELSEQGHIAKVQCAEVWCPMTPEFYLEYLDASKNHRKQELLYAMNPTKFQTAQFLIDFHESRGDKTIVFSDNIFALEQYALGLGKAYIYGGTPQSERMNILENFQHNPLINTLFLSKIGDTSLDLPEATVLIQISSQYGSRRQEAQRLGRILRAKRRNDEGFNAFFYSLVSTSTNETHYSSKRQAFLVNQGYAFKVITELQGMKQKKDLKFSTPAEQRELLQTVLLESERSATMEEKTDDLFHRGSDHARKKLVRRTAGGLGELSGGQSMAYAESSRGRKKVQSDFFKKLERERARRVKVLAEEGVPKPGQSARRR